MNETIIYPVASRVERVTNDYTNGRLGTVIEIDRDRRRIQWDRPQLRTWVNIKFLKPASTPKP